MRRLTTRWLPLLVTPLIALNFAPTVRADPIPYSSSGYVGAQGGDPIGNFSIDATSGFLLGPGSLQLATFQAPTVPTGATLTFTNMPFDISVQFDTNGNSPSDLSFLNLQGMLNGVLTGASDSSVVATVTSIQSSGPVPLPFSVSSFDVLTPQTLAPSGIDGGSTTLIGQVSAMSMPEPTPLALLGILAVGTALRSGIRRIRRRNGRAGS